MRTPQTIDIFSNNTIYYFELGMMLKSSVIVQDMTVKLWSCLRFQACGFVWQVENPMQERVRIVKLTGLALLSLYHIL